MTDREFRLKVFRKAALCRNFENEVFRRLESKDIQFPTYMSAGQEYISATLSTVLTNTKPLIFGQHRGHSTYLSYGGDIIKLIDELLGRKTGCAFGMGGSASIQSQEINMYGHDGLMGSQVPIAVGACYSTRKPTIAIMGDASAEEDYVLGALGWASTKKLPILFVVEDNNLSILTEKRIRRNWEMDSIARGFNMAAYNINDDPLEIRAHTDKIFKEPLLLNINTHRLYWHAGPGIDDEGIFDRYKVEMADLGEEALEIHHQLDTMVRETWQKQLEIR